MQETFFNPPIWMPIVLAMVGIAVFAYGNARVQAGVRNAGAGVLALVIAWSAVAYFVRTPIEQCLDRTRAIVSAVERGKWDELGPLLDKNTNLVYMIASLRGRDEIVRGTREAAERFSLKEIRIVNENPASEPSLGTIDVTINTLIEAQYNTTAIFKFEYEKRSDGILLTRISPVSIAGASSDTIRNGMPR